VEPAIATDWINDRAQSWALQASDGFVYVFSPSATQHSDPIAAFTDSECAAISSDAPSETMTAYCRQVRQDTLLYSPRVVATIYPPAPFCEPGQEPQFSSGFAALREELGDAMGTPTECEHPNSSNGDTLQATTKGLAFYRKSTNTPTFTDGSTHWGITSDGLISWAAPASIRQAWP